MEQIKEVISKRLKERVVLMRDQGQKTFDEEFLLNSLELQDTYLQKIVEYLRPRLTVKKAQPAVPRKPQQCEKCTQTVSAPAPRK